MPSQRDGRAPAACVSAGSLLAHVNGRRAPVFLNQLLWVSCHLWPCLTQRALPRALGSHSYIQGLAAAEKVHPCFA